MKEIVWSELENMSADEISNVMVEIDKELVIANNHLNLVESKDLELGRKILELRIQKNDNQIVLSKAKENCKKLSIQRRICEKKFWENRRR